MRLIDRYLFIIIILTGLSLHSCQWSTPSRSSTSVTATDSVQWSTDSITKEKNDNERIKVYLSSDIQLTHDLLYDKYTLDSIYPYKDTTRCFQWQKIKERLALLENIQQEPHQWGILQNYKNRNGEAPLVKKFKRNSYRRIADTLGTERYQSIPLYLLDDTITPERYAQDGDLTQLFEKTGDFVTATPIYIGEKWRIPLKYVKEISDSIFFNKAIVIDRNNQNIITLERKEAGCWMIRSMNPATTGRRRPPYAQETPLGMYVLQEKKVKMVFLKDGSKETGGYAPFANRFTDGAYIHGIPVNVPNESPIEYSYSLGTTPRSHMCVRNATSHAKFIFSWAPVNETIIFVLE